VAVWCPRRSCKRVQLKAHWAPKQTPVHETADNLVKGLGRRIKCTGRGMTESNRQKLSIDETTNLKFGNLVKTKQTAPPQLIFSSVFFPFGMGKEPTNQF